MNGNIYVFLAAALFFAGGCALGSFYNCICDRIPRGESIARGRSHCESCGHVLSAGDLVPLLSYAVLKGKCRYCGAKLSPVYVLSEALCGLLFLFAFLYFAPGRGLGYTLLMLALYSMLYICFCTDIKDGIISDGVVLIFSLAGLVTGILNGRVFKETLGGAACGLLIYGSIYLIARLILKKEGFGQGDVVLMTGIGSFFSPINAVFTAVLAFYVSLIFIVTEFCIRKNEEMQIPFAPSMCISALIMSIWGDCISSFITGVLGF